MKRTIGDGGINWNWYLCGNFNETDKTCHIYYYNRWHKYEHRGSNHPADVEWRVHMTILEDDKRNVYGIKLDNTEYLVTNPGNIFGYRDFSAYVPEPDEQVSK